MAAICREGIKGHKGVRAEGTVSLRDRVTRRLDVSRMASRKTTLPPYMDPEPYTE